MSELTRILDQIAAGDPTATNQLYLLVYDELRRLAAVLMANEKPGQTLQPTALVNEAWIKLFGGGHQQQWQNKSHFFAAAAEAMRRILVDQARRRAAARHGGNLARQELDSDIATAAPPAEIIAVHEALDALAAKDNLAADLIKLVYFGGFSVEEAGKLLGMSRATAYRLWTFGRAWLRAELDDRKSA